MTNKNGDTLIQMIRKEKMVMHTTRLLAFWKQNEKQKCDHQVQYPGRIGVGYGSHISVDTGCQSLS